MGSALNNYLTPKIGEHYDTLDPDNYENVGIPMFFSFYLLCFALVCTIGNSWGIKYWLISTNKVNSGSPIYLQHNCWLLKSVKIIIEDKCPNWPDSRGIKPNQSEFRLRMIKMKRKIRKIISSMASILILKIYWNFHPPTGY